MEPQTIGDVTMNEAGARLRLTIDEWIETQWSVEDARVAVDALQGWIREHATELPPKVAARARPDGVVQLELERSVAQDLADFLFLESHSMMRVNDVSVLLDAALQRTRARA